MRFGIIPTSIAPIATPGFYREVAIAAERIGFSSLWAPEHVVLFEEYESRMPYGDGRLLGVGGGPIDPFILLSFVAAVTSRIRLGTGVCLVAQRNPVYTAKDVACLDWMSGGRFDFGIGVGWLKEEYDAVGVPRARRGARTRDCLAIMQKLWSDTPEPHESEFYSLPRSLMDPKPVQRPHPPFIFGGESDAALERVADIGQGWYGYDLEPEQAASHIARLRQVLADRGRSPSDASFKVSPGRRRITREMVQGYAAAGVDELLLRGDARTSEVAIERMEAMAAEVGLRSAA